LTAVATVLGDEFDAMISDRLEEAFAMLDSEIGLIACGIHFDGGMLFELLDAA
jgi:hypothetical protein